MAPSPWQNILDQHISIVTLLETHASLLLDSMSQSFADENSTRQLLQTRLGKTEDLISFFKESAAELDDISTRTASGQPQSHTSSPQNLQSSRTETASTKPSVDASGLFSVDTNPTPLERLYRPRPNGKESIGQGAKRKVSDPEAPFGANGFSEHQHNHKRARSQEQDYVDVPEVDDSFERGVEAKLKAKEERRKAQENKKRKRESDASTTHVSAKGPKLKKQKQAHERKPQARSQNDQTQEKPLEIRRNNVGKRSNTGTTNGGTQPNKKRKKSK